MPITETVELEQKIAECAFYKAESIRALCLVAAEIKWVEDKERRAELRRLFKTLTGRTASVWARVPEYFPSEMNYKSMTADGMMALTFLCQLPIDDARTLYEAHAAHLNEPNAHLMILGEVNDARRSGHAAKGKTLAESCADLTGEWFGAGSRLKSADYFNCSTELAALPAVAAELKRRAEGKTE